MGGFVLRPVLPPQDVFALRAKQRHLTPAGLREHSCPRSRLAPAREYRGYLPSKRSSFRGLKLHRVCTDNQGIREGVFTPGSPTDVEGLYRLPLDWPEGCEWYGDRGYTDYPAEDDRAMAEGIRLRAIRKGNSQRYRQAFQWIAQQGRLTKSL